MLGSVNKKQMVQLLQKTVEQFLIKVNIFLQEGEKLVKGSQKVQISSYSKKYMPGM